MWGPRGRPPRMARDPPTISKGLAWRRKPQVSSTVKNNSESSFDSRLSLNLVRSVPILHLRVGFFILLVLKQIKSYNIGYNYVINPVKSQILSQKFFSCSLQQISVHLQHRAIFQKVAERFSIATTSCEMRAKIQEVAKKPFFIRDFCCR